MKVRKDFVTNSSSSSFIISRDVISYEKLKEICLKIANEEGIYWGDEDKYESYDEIAYRYEIAECTTESPYNVEYDWYGNSIEYTNHFIIDNNCCIRYNWDIIEKILSKHGISYSYGYCD